MHANRNVFSTLCYWKPHWNSRLTFLNVSTLDSVSWNKWVDNPPSASDVSDILIQTDEHVLSHERNTLPFSKTWGNREPSFCLAWKTSGNAHDQISFLKKFFLLLGIKFNNQGYLLLYGCIVFGPPVDDTLGWFVSNGPPPALGGTPSGRHSAVLGLKQHQKKM